MREILFRGKMVDNGKWAFGVPFETVVECGIKTFITSYAKWDSDDNSIDFFETDVDEIIPETVGQYTGLTDKNGKKIFEGDIIKYFPLWEYNEEVGKIGWSKIKAGFIILLSDGAEDGFYPASMKTREVIGNIYDNPKLLNEV